MAKIVKTDSAKPEKKKKKPSKPRRSPKAFFKDVISELKKVTWPSRKELISYSIAVLVFVAVFAIVIGIMDYGLAEALSLVVKK